MHTGALMAARQALGQYFLYARPWQRVLIVAGVTGGAGVLIAVGLATGHFVLAAAGAVLLLAVGNAVIRVLRGRKRAETGEFSSHGQCR